MPAPVEVAIGVPAIHGVDDLVDCRWDLQRLRRRSRRGNGRRRLRRCRSFVRRRRRSLGGDGGLLRRARRLRFARAVDVPCGILRRRDSRWIRGNVLVLREKRRFIAAARRSEHEERGAKTRAEEKSHGGGCYAPPVSGDRRVGHLYVTRRAETAVDAVDHGSPRSTARCPQATCPTRSCLQRTAASPVAPGISRLPVRPVTMKQ